MTLAHELRHQLAAALLVTKGAYIIVAAAIFAILAPFAYLWQQASSKKVSPTDKNVEKVYAAEERNASGKTRDEIAEAYVSEPWWYDLRGLGILTFAYNNTVPQQLRFFAPNFGEKHIEVACGSGNLLRYFLDYRRLMGMEPKRPQIVGIDYAMSMLEGARRQFKNDKNVTIEHADAAALPYPENSFDTANIANSIHCFPAVDAALVDILRVLKPGGTLAANVLLYPEGWAPLVAIANWINVWGIKKGILYSPFTVPGIRQQVLDAGYEIVSEYKQGNCWNVVARKPFESKTKPTAKPKSASKK